MKKLRYALSCAVLLLLVAGCGKPPELAMQKLADDAPAAAALPPAPVGEAPTPLIDRTPFGLYANYPSRDTLEALSVASLSPSGRFRAAFTASQGLWVVRVDGAWLWQVPLPDAPNPNVKATNPNAQPGLGQPVTPPPDTPATGKPAGTVAAANQPNQPVRPAGGPKATKYMGPLDWTPQGTLLLRDDTGTWVEIDPEGAKLTLLPAVLQGKDWLTFSPDRKQVMYYMPGKTGRQLWIAKADGTEPKFLGENVTGTFDPAGKPVVTKVAPEPASKAKPGIPETDLIQGLHQQ